MTFPDAAAYASGQNAGAGTTHTVTLPSGVTTGQQLLVFFSSDGNPTLSTSSTGWSLYGQASNGTAVTGGIFSKVATGSDALTVTTSASEQTSHISVRIPDVSTFSATSANGSGSNSNPPAHTPAEGAQDYLWLVSRHGDSTTVATDPPTSYSNMQTVTASDVGGASTNVAERDLNASTENPGTFSSASEQWVCWTVSVAASSAAVAATTTAAVTATAGVPAAASHTTTAAVTATATVPASVSHATTASVTATATTGSVATHTTASTATAAANASSPAAASHTTTSTGTTSAGIGAAAPAVTTVSGSATANVSSPAAVTGTVGPSPTITASQSVAQTAAASATVGPAPTVVANTSSPTGVAHTTTSSVLAAARAPSPLSGFRTAVAHQPVRHDLDLAIAFTAVDTLNGNYTPGTGRHVLAFRNTSGSAVTASLSHAPSTDPEDEGDDPGSTPVVCAAGAETWVAILPTQQYTQPDGRLLIDFSSSAGMSLAVIEVRPRW